jgi:hypothetical protein
MSWTIQAQSATDVHRPYAQVYKNLALAQCITQAYKDAQPDTVDDLKRSVDVLKSWVIHDVYYAAESEMQWAVDSYLARSYPNPMIFDSPQKSLEMKFNFLKCLDLFHSRELDFQVDRFIWHPNRNSVQDTTR